MKQKLLGALTGAALGAAVLVGVPTAAQALSWSTYGQGNYAVGSMLVSGAAKTWGNKGRIFAPADGLLWTQQYTVVEKKPKGKILANTSAAANGNWVTVGVPSPVTNTEARCKLAGPPHSRLGDFICQVQK
ncbi:MULTISPECIES: hypothetical protein [unclassified Leucobacter]|uniref:hypothetical protein n=1 Tax=unclassified Leucobacter TaxID=2621730 RepID=UPI003016235C